MADRLGDQAHLLKIYQPLKDVLDDLSDSEVLYIIDYSCRSPICDRLGGSVGELGGPHGKK
ncbi:hypothetical protein E2C01_052830 [Portunus trituberculatus]|uniref:Uncharacterized protein n=1 Tax=Portunus trituberculatus TaxID=210409 RepID=A0A5B7GEQ9_PORTR|nr:hypothetical protein [Portunus trituberculatus]